MKYHKSLLKCNFEVLEPYDFTLPVGPECAEDIRDIVLEPYDFTLPVGDKAR